MAGAAARPAPAPKNRGWLDRGSTAQRRGLTRAAWSRFRLTMIQVVLAVVLSIGICLGLGHPAPWFGPLVAVTLLQVICAPHHRGLWLFAFGVVNGALIGTLFNPAWSTARAAVDALVGLVVAVCVAVATTPTRPVRMVNEAIEPLLSRLATNTRAIAAALRGADQAAAGRAVSALDESDNDLQRLYEVLLQVRRSAILTRWRSGIDLDDYTQTAKEIGYAVRDVRTMARHAWWGVLRPGEPVPAALPQMLDTLADGIAVLRDELRENGTPAEARPLLISASRWIEVMRAEPLSISAGTVAASADAAVLALLTAIGVPVNDADQMLHRPTMVEITERD